MWIDGRRERVMHRLSDAIASSNRYKEAIKTFVLVLDLYFKHLEQLKQQQVR